MKLHVLLLAGLCVVAGQAQAGLFSDEEAHIKIQQLDVRIAKLEESSKQQSETIRQQTQSMLELQTQIESQNAELRKLRGQLEELTHGLQEAEGRQKDFYVDLDTRVRHFETLEVAAPPAVPAIAQPDSASEIGDAAGDPVVENRAYESAYRLFKGGSYQKAVTAFQEFLKKFPDSVHTPNVHFSMASAYFALKDYKNALASYQLLLLKFPYSPKVADAMFGMADSQQELNNTAAVKKTLKQIIAKYPGSEMADKARKRLASLK